MSCFLRMTLEAAMSVTGSYNLELSWFWLLLGSRDHSYSVPPHPSHLSGTSALQAGPASRYRGDPQQSCCDLRGAQNKSLFQQGLTQICWVLAAMVFPLCNSAFGQEQSGPCRPLR